MDAPLCVLENKRSLTVVRNGELIQIPFPAQPYVLCQTSMTESKDIDEYTDLYTKNPIKLAKVEFDNTKDAYDFYNGCGKKGAYHHSIKDQILIDIPEYFKQFPNTDPLKVLFLDIEVKTDGSGVFPKASKDPIISIGAKPIGQDTKLFMNYSEEHQDVLILKSFAQFYKEYDPDIVCAYNAPFDCGYIIGRLQKHKMNLSFLTRDNSLPFRQKPDGTMKYYFSGRIIKDLYDDVMKDQSIVGKVPNKKLKTICKHYNIEAISEDTANTTPLINTPQLAKYQTSDVIVLEKLFNIYFPKQEYLSNLLGIPLEETINGYSSTIPKIIMGRELVKMKYIPLENNEDRYGATDFEAAYVDIHKTGRFDEVRKVDVISQYPSVIRTFNLGPDTTEIISELPYEKGRFDIVSNGDYLYITTSDENFKKTFLIRVNLKFDGILRKLLKPIFEKRLSIKDLIKTASVETKPIYEAQSNAYKILLNSIYGFCGLKYSRFGDMATGIATVSLARWIIKLAKSFMGDTPIETDSVPGYTPIYVKDKKNNNIKIIPIESLHKTNNKRDIYNGDYQVLSYNGWTNIIYTKKHKVEKDIYRVSTNNGFVDITCDHSLFTDEMKEVKPTELKIGDSIKIVNDINLRSKYYDGNITSIEKLNSNLQYVYDISTDDGSFTCARGNILLHNTDGIYCDKKINVDELNSFITLNIVPKIKTNSYMEFEEDGPWIGYFYKAKNYVLMDEAGKITYHGVSLNNSKAAKLQRMATDRLAKEILQNAPEEALKESVLELRDLTRYSLSEFQLHISPTKRDYGNNALQTKLIQKFEAFLQREFIPGEPIDYFKVADGYEIAQNVSSIEQLDKDYYLKLITNAQEIFNLGDIHKTKEQIEEERRQVLKRVLMAKKKELKAYANGEIIDNEKFNGLSFEAANTEINRISDIQQALLKKWPCLVCQKGDEYTIEYPQGLRCSCGWVGVPNRPIKVRKSKKKKED